MNDARSPLAGERQTPAPLLAVITGELTPYRVHFHRRIARETPEVRLATLLVVDPKSSAWVIDDPLINTHRLAAPDRGPGRLSRLRRDWATGRALVSWLDENRPGAVFINGYQTIPLLRGLLWCRMNDVPAFHWADSNIRGDNPRGIRRALKRLIMPLVFAQFSVCFSCGSLGRAYYRRYRVPDEKIIESPVEPDYEQILSLDPVALQEAADTFALTPDRKRIVVSSRLVPVKRIDLAIRAFDRIADRRPEWELVILGAGPLRESLEASVPERLRGRVRFLGFVGRQELVTGVYRLSQVLLHPAEFEPWALVINEAVAAGLAIVTTSAVGAAVELVQDGFNGRIVPPGDLDALTEALAEVTQPGRADTMRAASPTMLQRWWTLADPVEGLRSALSQVGVVPTFAPRVTGRATMGVPSPARSTQPSFVAPTILSPIDPAHAQVREARPADLG